MSNIGNAIKMATLLLSRGKMKISELANELEVSERAIRKYRDDLEQASIHINSETGKYGGYSLYTGNFLLNNNITNEDNIALSMVKEYLKYNDFMYTKEVQHLVDKLESIISQNNKLRGDFNFYLKQAKTNCDAEFEQEKLMKINEAIITKRKVKIKYFSLTSGLNTRIIRPYATFQYKGDMYLASFCEQKQQVLDFKMLRIKKYEILDEKFEFPSEFSLKSVLDNCIGIYKDEEVEIKLKIKKPMSYIVSEKIWVNNQQIEWEEDESIIFTAKMRGLTEIKSWILSMGGSVEVLEPEKLRNEIIDEIENMKKLYKI